MDKQALIRYIAIINDRNLQKKQTSGFTQWAILGILAYLILDFCDKIPLIFSSPEVKFYSIIILAIILNFSLCAILLFFSITVPSEIPKMRRLSSKISSNSSLVLYLPSVFILLFSAFINLEAANYMKIINLNPWPLRAFSIYFAFTAIISISQKINQYRISKKAKFSYPEICEFSNKIRIAISIIAAIISITGILILYIAYWGISIPIETNDISLALKTGFEIVGFFLLVLIFFDNISSSNKYKWLENLETEIYLEDLSENEIKEKLDREYLGVKILKWISLQDGKINTITSEFLDLIKEETENLESITTIDKSFQHERIGRLEEIDVRVKGKFNDYLDIIREINFKLDEIKKQGLFDKEEEVEIKNFTVKWSKQSEAIPKKFEEFYEHFNQINSNDISTEYSPDAPDLSDSAVRGR